MLAGRIRVICLGLIKDDNERFLFDSMMDPQTGTKFLRPIGGGIEFGESMENAMKRECYEEIGAETASVKQIGFFDNIFEYNGKPGHEIVVLFNLKLKNKSLYQNPEIEIIEGKETRVARWFSRQELHSQLIYPPKVKDYL